MAPSLTRWSSGEGEQPSLGRPLVHPSAVSSPLMYSTRALSCCTLLSCPSNLLRLANPTADHIVGRDLENAHPQPMPHFSSTLAQERPCFESSYWSCLANLQGLGAEAGTDSQGKARFLMDVQSASQLQLHRTTPHAPSFTRGRVFTSVNVQRLECFSLPEKNPIICPPSGSREYSFDLRLSWTLSPPLQLGGDVRAIKSLNICISTFLTSVSKNIIVIDSPVSLKKHHEICPFWKYFFKYTVNISFG